MENSTQPASFPFSGKVRAIPEEYFHDVDVNHLEGFSAYGPDEDADFFLSFANDKGTLYGVYISASDVESLAEILRNSEPD